MPAKLQPPIQKESQLEKTDLKYGEEGDSPTLITVRQAREGENEQRNDLFTIFERSYNGATVTITQRVSYDDVRRREIFLTLVACNILDEKKKPLFRFKDGKLEDEEQFEIAWAQLWPDTANEIHEKVLELNPQWSQSGEGR